MLGPQNIIWFWQGQRVDGKSNEITAIPELLDLLDLKDTIITIDAMGTSSQDCRPNYPPWRRLYPRTSSVIKAISIKESKPSLSRRLLRIGRALRSATLKQLRQAIIGLNIGKFGWFPLASVPNLPNHKKWKGLATIVMVRRRRLLTEYRNGASLLLHHQSRR